MRGSGKGNGRTITFRFYPHSIHWFVPGQIPGGRRNGKDILIKLHEGEYFEDWQKQLGHKE